jgi:hypothetical protein
MSERVRAARFAGIVLILNGILALSGSLWRESLGPLPRIVALVDLALGISLLSRGGWRTIVIMRCVLGAVVLTGLEVVGGHIQVVNNDWAGAATQALFSAGILALLVGRPRVPQIVVGVLLASVAVLDRAWYLFRW